MPDTAADYIRPINGPQETLETRVYSSFHALPDRDLAAWQRLARSGGVAIYQTPVWAQVWWHHYGVGRDLRIVIVEHRRHVVAVLPAFVERLGRGPLALTVAKVVGSDHSITRASFPADPSCSDVAMGAACAALLNEGCDVVSFAPVGVESGLVDRLRSAIADRGRVEVRSHSPPVHMSLDLSGGVEGVFARMSRNTRKSQRRTWRMVQAIDGVAVEALDGDAATNELAAFIDMHQRQWKTTGAQGHFDDWPQAREFHHDLAVALSDDRAVVLYRLSINGRPVAYEYVHRHGATTYSLLAARELDVDPTIGVGTALALEVLRTEHDRGSVLQDLGQAHYDYKASLGATETDLVRIRVMADSTVSRARVRMWHVLVASVNLVYYRLWFSRIRSRIRRHGLRTRTLSQRWIRMRF